MLLWVIFAVLTAFAAVLILLPLRWQAPAGTVAARDVDIYKQQLKEIDGERAAGLLGEDEAKAARIEISRRLIAATEAAERAAKDDVALPDRFPVAAYAMAGLIAVISIGGYMIYGSPDLPAQPHAARSEQPVSMQAFVERIERQLKKNPEDGAGWNAIGMLYMRSGRFAEAADAYRKAIKFLGEDVDRLANLGEAMAFSANGTVNAEARALFDKVLTQDAAHAKANFWVALADEQAGKLAEAAERYKRMLAGNFPEEGRALLRKRLAAIEAELGGGAQSAGSAAPGQETAQADGSGGGGTGQSAAEAEMIAEMVGRLAERLKKDGSDLKGWLMLVRAYTVLGRKDDALQAVADAKGNFKGNEDALRQIDALAQSLGLSS